MIAEENTVALSSANYLDDMFNMSDELSTDELGTSEVAEFFKGRNVLLTGGFGYLGSLLIEKLLRGCSDMGKLYLLVRPKKGKTSEERLKKLFSNVVYDRVKREHPNYMERVTIIEGDTGKSDLGLSPKDRKLLADTVHVIFHGAATVRFNEPLSAAVKVNVRSVRLLIQLAKEMKNLEAFVHISTAFSKCHLDDINETYYTPYLNVGKILALDELLDAESMNSLTPRLIGECLNTYTFSKALGEEAVRRYGTGLPICIVRPSIMVQTYKEPVRNWCNGFTGLTGLTGGLALCLLRTIFVDYSKVVEMIPADYVINQIIVAAWDISRSTNLSRMNEITVLQEGAEEEEVAAEEKIEPPIYNCVSSVQRPILWGEYVKTSIVHGMEVPSMKVMWYHTMWVTDKKWLYIIYETFLHFIPGLMIDGVLVLTGRKPKLLKVYKKIHGLFLEHLARFCTTQWNFDNANTMSLIERMSLADRKYFDFDVRNLDWHEFAYYQPRGVRAYTLKDPPETLPAARKRYFRLVVLHWTIVAVFSLLFLWYLFKHLF